MAHQIQIKELVNGIEITENLDGVVVVKLLSYNSRPFFRTTNEDDVESYQVLDTLGEIYHLPALANEFILIDLEGNYWQPDNGTELIEYSYKIRAFRPENEFDKVLNVGTVEATSNTVKVNIPSVGLPNSVLINGSVYENYYPSLFNFVAVVEFTKILIVYAKPDSTVFYLAQGVEALSAVEPDYEGLFVARLIVNVSGIVIEEGGNNGDVLVKNGNSQEWSPRLTVAEQELVTIESRLDDLDDNDNSLQEQITAEITERQNADIAESNARTFADGVLDGKITTEKNRNDSQDSLISVNTTAISTLNSHKSSVVDKMLHYWDASVGKWISSGVEVAGNAILKLKIITFGGYTIAQKNAIASPVEGMLIYQNQSPKGFQKYENGAWAAIVSNISNADLSNVSARTFTQGNSFTWNTAGFKYYLKNLVDKTGDLSYNKTLIIHPTTGEMVTKNVQGENLVISYKHSANREIQPTAIDYSTGYVTAVAHGFTNGSTPKQVGLFPNGYSTIDSNIFGLLTARVFPDEWVKSDIYVKVIDDNTLMICNSAGNLIAVNPTSGNNNGRLDLTKWHIEDFVSFSLDIPFGIKRVEVMITGMTVNWTSNKYYAFSTTNGTDYLGTLFYAIGQISINSFVQAVYVTQKLNIDVTHKVVTMSFEETNIYDIPGFGYISNNPHRKVNKIMTAAYLNLGKFESRGSNGIITPYQFCNGSTIEIYN